MIDWPFDGCEPGTFRGILADPPWRFLTRSAKGLQKSPQAHYKCESLEDIQRFPVADLTPAGDAVLIMWATAPMLPQAIDTMKAWGFRHISAGAWAKQTARGKWAFGTGYFFRSAAEFYLLGHRGKPKIRARNIRNLITAKTAGHSVKPDDLHGVVERMIDGPYIELFARRTRPGWTTWGNEVARQHYDFAKAIADFNRLCPGAIKDRHPPGPSSGDIGIALGDELFRINDSGDVLQARAGTDRRALQDALIEAGFCRPVGPVEGEYWIVATREGKAAMLQWSALKTAADKAMADKAKRAR